MRHSLPRLFCIAILGLAATRSHAETAASGPETRHFAKSVDTYHRSVCERVETAATRLDEWLTPNALESDLKNDTVIRLRLSLVVKESDGARLRPALGGQLALPGLEKWLRLFAESISGQILPGREEDTQEERTPWHLGLRLHTYHYLRQLLNWDVGLKFDPEPVAFTAMHGGVRQQAGRGVLTLGQRGFWYSDDGFGEKTEFHWEYPLRQDLEFRTTTAALWSESSTGVEFEQTFRTTYVLSPDRRYLQFAISAFAHKSSHATMDDYRAVIAYSRSLYRQWLFLELAPQIDWSREASFDPVLSFRVSLSAYFGSRYSDL